MASTYYIDLYNGNDGNDGSSWANAWKTISGGALAARIAPGDTIRISKTPDPVSIGNGKWTLNTQASGGFPATKSISSSTNASPIEITTSTAHGYSTGDVVQIYGHSGNNTANGAWVITYVSTTKFTIDGSVGIGIGSSGTAQLINSKVIVLETANTVNIDRCHTGWNNGIDTTVQITNSTYKDGTFSVQIDFDSTPTQNSLQGYNSVSNLDLSGYQYISFWIKNDKAITDASTLTITLCSDTVGAIPVDTFTIPAIPSTNRIIPLTLARSGGGNLGSSIRSIAINSGATAPPASMRININNIIATKTNGINLQSLISKNSSAQGGTGAFYGIQSINGKVVLVDNDTNTLSNAGRGYYETSETCTTYIRETFKTALASSSSTVVSELLDSGTLGNLISYEFGYEVGTTNQNGETFLDGLNGYGYGIYVNQKNYFNINLLGIIRYYHGIYLDTCRGSGVNLNTISNANNCTSYAINLGYSNTVNVNKISNACNNTQAGVYFTNSSNSLILSIINLCNNITSGLYFTSNCFDTWILNLTTSANNSQYGVYLGNAESININTVHTIANGTASIYNNSSINYVRNATMDESTQITAMTSGSKAELWSIKEDGAEGNNWGYFYGSTYNWQTTTKHGSEPGAGKITITSSERNSAYKIPIKVAEIACEADKLVTVTAWVKKDHATNVACQLRVDTDVVTGVTGDTTVKADDTDWEELTLTFTPDFQSVCEVWFDSWYSGGNSNTYIGSLTINQSA